MIDDADAMLNAVLTQAVDYAVFSSGPDGGAIIWNESLKRLFGYEEGEVSELAALNLFEAEQGGVPATLEAPMEFECWLRRKDGSVFRGRGRINEESPGSERLVWVVRDLSEPPQSRESGRKFISVVAHDLREPLNSVYGFTQLLLKKTVDKLSQEESQYLTLIKSAAQRMNSLIVALQDYNKLELAKEEHSTIDAAQLLEDAKSALKQVVEERKATITAGPLPKIRGTLHQLGQLFHELLYNAIRFCPAEREPRITVTAEPRSGHWLFSFADEAPGIEPARAEKVFEPFVRSGGSSAGRGLGLAACRKIVERHGGRIWAEPNSQGGTTFRLILPKGD